MIYSRYSGGDNCDKQIMIVFCQMREDLAVWAAAWVNSSGKIEQKLEEYNSEMNALKQSLGGD